MKIVAVPILALLLSCTLKPTYNKMVETTYNFNTSAVSLIISSNTAKADFLKLKIRQVFLYLKKIAISFLRFQKIPVK